MKGVDSAHRRNPLLFDLMPAAFSRARFAPLPARPCGSVWVSKIFTQFPRSHWAPVAFSRARFAPPSSLGLMVPSGGAKSSHNSRALAGRRPLPFPGRGSGARRFPAAAPSAVGATAVLSRAPPFIQKIPEAHSASGIFICLIFLYLSISIRWDSGVPK